jgi:glucan 1,3-beta-glucosidase
MGFIQTETPYYQPNPSAPVPYVLNSALHDPDFGTSCAGQAGNCRNAWGLRVINSQNILVYGAGLYSFFDNYSTSTYLYIFLLCLITDKRSALGCLKC